ncbi:MAG TPA: alpha/beta hydrolase [Acidimicrobiales bacterium]|nr:alpha/beta hydrolase [Acidimicrobiales bacterium]
MPAAEELDLHVRGHRIHAQRFGAADAPLVIGLHGATLNMHAFDLLGERLGGDDLQLVAVDLRGRGRSERTGPGTYGWDQHALDAVAVADALGAERCAIVGQSMGASVAMKAAELASARLDAVVLIDMAGRVDRGVGELVASSIGRPGGAFQLIDPWDEWWDRCRAYDAEHGVDDVAIAEDRAYGATQDVYGRWQHLTMPTLLVCATVELRPGVGYVVPVDDRSLFARAVPTATVVEVAGTHVSVNVHEDTATAISRFISGA